MRRISIFLLTVYILTLFSTFTVFAASHDPYAGFLAKEYDKVVNQGSLFTVNSSDTVVGLSTGAYLVFENVNFGASTPYKVDIFAGAPMDTPSYMGGTIEIRLDSITSQPISSVVTVSTSVSEKLSFEITTEFTGVHDVYVSIPNKQCNLYSLKFHALADESIGYTVYEEPDYLKDIEDNSLKSKIYTLIELGLIKPFLTDEFNMLMGITRADFALMMAEVLNADAYATDASAFSDVEAGSDYAKAITYLKSAGIISGDSNSLFKPDDYITGQDAVVMVVRVLGYENIAKFKGGYPTGYLSVAANEGIIDGVETGGVLRRDSLVKLIYNMINADFLEIDVINADGADYRRVNGILSKTKKIYKGSGTVNGNSETNLVTPDSSLNAGEVYINGNEFNAGNSCASSLLGYNVLYYYREENDEKVLLSVSPQKNVEVTTIDTKNDDSVITFIESKLVYYKDGKDVQATLNIPLGTHMIYNGKALDDTLANTLQTDTFRGTIRFIDNGDSAATLLIDQYQNILVKSVNSETEKIYDSLTDATFTFDSSEDNISIIYKGKAVYFNVIDINNVISVYESKNRTGKKLIRLIISTATKKGTISEVGDDTFCIDGTTYKKAREATQNFYPGLNAKYYISDAGEVVDYKVIVYTTGDKFGLLLDFNTFDNSNRLDSKQKLKIFTAEESTSIYNCADGIIIDGIICKKPEQTASGKGAFPGLKNMSVKKTLVRYNVNTNNEITLLDTYVKVADNGNDTLAKLTKTITTFNYNGTSMLFTNSGGYAICPYKSMPAIFGYWEEGNEDTVFYNKALSNYVSTSSSVAISGDIYTLDERKPYANYVVWYGANSSADWEMPFIFGKMNTSINSDGEEVYKIYGYENDAQAQYFIRKNDFDSTTNTVMAEVRSIFNNAEPGDAIRVKVSAQEYIESAELIFRADGATTNGDIIAIRTNKNNGLGNVGGVSHYYYTLYGTVVDKMDDFFKVQYNKNGVMAYEYFKISSKSMRYDYNNGSPTIINNISTDNIIIGDKILSIAQPYTTKILCVYNHPNL